MKRDGTGPFDKGWWLYMALMGAFLAGLGIYCLRFDTSLLPKRHDAYVAIWAGASIALVSGGMLALHIRFNRKYDRKE